MSAGYANTAHHDDKVDVDKLMEKVEIAELNLRFEQIHTEMAALKFERKKIEMMQKGELKGRARRLAEQENGCGESKKSCHRKKELKDATAPRDAEQVNEWAVRYWANTSAGKGDWLSYWYF